MNKESKANFLKSLEKLAQIFAKAYNEALANGNDELAGGYVKEYYSVLDQIEEFKRYA